MGSPRVSQEGNVGKSVQCPFPGGRLYDGRAGMIAAGLGVRQRALVVRAAPALRVGWHDDRCGAI